MRVESLEDIYRLKQQNERAAMDAFYILFFLAVWRTARQWCPNDTAADATQETFISYFTSRYWQDPRPEDNPAALLTTICTRKCWEIRKKERRVLVDAEVVEENGTAIEGCNLEQVAFNLQLKECLEALEPGAQRLVRLKAIEGYTLDELVPIFRSNRNRLAIQLRRHLKRLRECLARHGWNSDCMPEIR